MGQYIDEKKVETLLRKLVSIESPYFHEDEIMDYAHKWLKDHDLDAEIHTYFEPKETKFHGKNVVGIMDSGKEGPVVYLGGHLDTVNLCNGWTKPPYEGIVEDGYLYGVGAVDMKSGSCAILLAMAEFAAKNKNAFKGKVIYHFVSDEEGPYGLGTVYIIHDQIHNVAKDVDFAIITEPSASFTGLPHPCICLGARGGYNYTIRVYGKSAHAATPEMGVNALTDASKIVCQLENLVPAEDEKLGRAAMCVIDVRGKGGACSVPDYAEIEVFRHCVRGETMETIQKEVEGAIKKAQIKSKAEIAFRPSPVEGFDGGFLPYCIDENDDNLKALEKTVEKVCGEKANLSYFESIGDFNHIGGKLGIPTVLIGADGDNFHSANERVDLKSVLETTRIIYEFLVETLAE